MILSHFPEPVKILFENVFVLPILIVGLILERVLKENGQEQCNTHLEHVN